MSKFKLLHDHLVLENIIRPDQIFLPRPASFETVTRVHHPDYVRAFQAGTWSAKVSRRIGLGWQAELVQRTFAEVGGTIAAMKLALRFSLSCNTAGGTHHAFPDYGTGFCVLNDIAITARLALDKGWAQRIAVIDLDVHQGDGTAFIFRDEPRVFTFSMHGARNFPFRKQTSDWDIGLANDTGDDVYMETLRSALPEVLSRHRPDLVIYDAGADAHRDDKLGKLALSDAGLMMRDRYVLETCMVRRIPVVAVIGGGYADHRPDLAARHAILHRVANALFRHHFPQVPYQKEPS